MYVFTRGPEIAVPQGEGLGDVLVPTCDPQKALPPSQVPLQPLHPALALFNLREVSLKIKVGHVSPPLRTFHGSSVPQEEAHVLTWPWTLRGLACLGPTIPPSLTPGPCLAAPSACMPFSIALACFLRFLQAQLRGSCGWRSTSSMTGSRAFQKSNMIEPQERAEFKCKYKVKLAEKKALWEIQL